MYIHIYNKHKINSLVLRVQVIFARSRQWSVLKWLTKFVVGYMLNKDLSSVSHKNITKLDRIEGKKTNKGNFQY